MTAPAPQLDTKRCTYAIGLDVGGTKIAAGVVTQDGKIVERITVPTPQTPSQAPFLEAICEVTDTLCRNHACVSAVGVGAAGMVDWPSGRIRWAPNNVYRDLPLRQHLTTHTGLPAIVENDANTAAIAEARLGSGAGYHTVVVLTIGTGIGGGLILDGQLYRGPTGIAAEVGHLLVNPRGGPSCGCGATGCLEAMASGLALTRAGRIAAHATPGGTLARISGAPGDATGETVHQAAQLGDPIARGLFDEMGYWLGIGIASLVNLLDPQIVILTGGIPGAVGDLLLDPTRASFERFVFARTHRSLPAIVLARLGPDAGLIGAAMLALGQPAAS
jgi:glucokinase